MNYLFIFTSLFLVGFIIWMVKYLEKKLPERDKRIKQEWEVEELKKIHQENKENLKIQKEANRKKLEEIEELEKIEKKKNEETAYISKNTKKLTYKEKVEKGKRYEAHVANYFKEKGYYVWEHGKQNGRKDKGIDLFVRKDNHAYFIQCKDWASWKISHKEIKATRMDIREYLKENKEFWKLIKEKDVKILYATSKECLTRGAFKYIEENNDVIEYRVIPIK